MQRRDRKPVPEALGHECGIQANGQCDQEKPKPLQRHRFHKVSYGRVSRSRLKKARWVPTNEYCDFTLLRTEAIHEDGFVFENWIPYAVIFDYMIDEISIPSGTFLVIRLPAAIRASPIVLVDRNRFHRDRHALGPWGSMALPSS